MDYHVEWLLSEVRETYIKFMSQSGITPADVVGFYYRIESATNADLMKCGYRLVVEKVERH